MAGSTPDGDGLGSLIRIIEEMRTRLDELARPTGTQTGSLVAQVQAALANINATVQAAIQASSYTAAQIDDKIANPGNVSAGSVSVGGVLRAMSVWSTVLTTNYRATWSTGVDGQLGYVPSSRRFKTDIDDLELDVAGLLALRPVVFRYFAQVPFAQELQPLEAGLIAEEVDELGLTWLVDYDEEGAPFGVRYHLLPVVMLLVLQDQERRLRDAGL